MAKKKNDSSVAVSIGIGMLAALSAGAYYLYGTKEGAKKKLKIRGWVLKAKGEVMDKLETMKELNEEKYNQLVTTVTEKYKKIKSIDQTEVEDLVTDLKKHWKNIKKHLEEPSKPKTKKKVVAKKK